MFPIENIAIYEFSKIEICVVFFRLWLRVCLAFHAQSDFWTNPGALNVQSLLLFNALMVAYQIANLVKSELKNYTVIVTSV